MLRKPQIKNICVMSFSVGVVFSLLLLNVKQVSSVFAQVACQFTVGRATPYSFTTFGATGIVATVFRGTLPPTSTSTITPSPAFISEADVTLVGEVFPTVNCGPDRGGGSPNRDYQTARQPMEYHLIDSQGNNVRLSFDTENLYTIYKQKWLAENRPQNASIQETMTRIPDYV